MLRIVTAKALLWLLLVGGSSSAVAATGPDIGAPRVDNAVVFIVDVSHSMSDYEVSIARESHAAAITSYEVLQAVDNGALGRSAFAYVEFATRAETLIEWTIIDSATSAQAFAYRIRNQGNDRLGGLTAIGEALHEAVALFRALPFSATRHVVDVTGDGANNSGRGIDGPRGELLDMDVIINGLPMIFNTRHPDLTGYYGQRIIGGPGAFVLTLELISDMPMMMRQKIVMELF